MISLFKNFSVKVLTDFIEKFIQMSYSHSCADKIQKGGRPSLTALSFSPNN